MKRSKNRLTAFFIRAASMLLIISLVSVSAFAYSDGDKLNFTHTTDNGGVDIFDIDGNVGFCCEPGARSASSGKMTVDHVARDSKLAKVFYYCYTHNGNWFSKVNKYTASPVGPYWRLALEAMAQYAVNGRSAVNYWRDNWPSTTYAYADEIVDFVDNTCANVQVPSSFRVFIGRQSGQDSAAFYIAPPGYVSLQKKAAKGPYNNRGASLAGAVYNVYTDSACTTRAKGTNGSYVVLTTTASGSTNAVEVDEGTYYAKEVTASPGFKLDPTVRSVTVTSANTSGNPAKFQSSEPLETGFVKLKKQSGNTDITG